MFNWNDFMNDFPYTNFSDINVSWFLNKFKQIFDEWQGLYTSLQEWKTATDAYNEQWRDQQEQAFQNWENNFQNAIDEWKAQTETDIGTWESDTIANLETWKNTFITEYNTLKAQVEQIAIDAENAKNAAEQSAQNAQASAASAQQSAEGISQQSAQIMTNKNDIDNLKDFASILYEDVTFTFHQGTLNSQYGTATNNATRIYSDYTNNFKNLVIETSVEYDYSIFWYIAPVENATSNFIYPSSGWISGTNHIGIDIEIPENAMLMRFAVRKHDNSAITPEEFQGTITRYIHDSSISEYMNYSPNVLYLCRDGRVTESVPPNSKYAVKMAAENQYDKIRFSAQKTTDDYFVAVHDTYIDQLAVNRDGTAIPANTVKTNV